MESLLVERLSIQGSVILPLATWAIVAINVPVTTKVNALSTYKRSKKSSGEDNK
jgi:hypothetical protein